MDVLQDSLVERNICQLSATDGFCFGRQGQTDLILPIADQNTFLNYSNTEVLLCFTKSTIAFIYYCYPSIPEISTNTSYWLQHWCDHSCICWDSVKLQVAENPKEQWLKQTEILVLMRIVHIFWFLSHWDTYKDCTSLSSLRLGILM